MDALLEWPSVLWNFLFFLPFFFGLFLLGAIKGFIVLPFSLAVLSIGNSVVLLGLWPAHVIGMYYSITRYQLAYFIISTRTWVFGFIRLLVSETSMMPFDGGVKD